LFDLLYIRQNKRINESIKKRNKMASTSDIKMDCVLNTTMTSTKSLNFFIKPGKGPAFVRTKLRSLSNGKVDNTFSAGHKIEEVRVENHKFQYLYPEGMIFIYEYRNF
jgi:elongation factor P